MSYCLSLLQFNVFMLNKVFISVKKKKLSAPNFERYCELYFYIYLYCIYVYLAGFYHDRI